MAKIDIQGDSDELSKGTVLQVSDVESENDAILAVENFLRLHKTEGLEFSLTGESEGVFKVTLK